MKEPHWSEVLLDLKQALGSEEMLSARKLIDDDSASVDAKLEAALFLMQGMSSALGCNNDENT